MEKYKPIKLETISKSSLKASQEKSIKKQVLDSLPNIEPILDKIWTKKSNIQIGKQKPHFVIYFINDEPCFLQPKEGPIIPHLKLLHKYPSILPSCQVDNKGMKNMISGANVMIPGLISEGGKLPQGKIPHNLVAVYIEGMENAISIGQMTMSPEDMKETQKGIGVEVYTYIGDGAWNIK